MTPQFSTFVMDESHNAWNWTSNADCPKYFGGLSREVLGITIHYWGDPAPTYEQVLSFFCDSEGRDTSAHYIAEAGRVACIVSPYDVSWACGSAYGNAKTISIECNPRASDRDYQTIAELIRYLRGIYGDIPLYPHKHWVSTSCPGNYDLNRLDLLARNGDVITTVALTPEDIDAIYNREFPREGSSMGGSTNWGAIVRNFDASFEASKKEIIAEIKQYIDQKLAALPAPTVTATVDNAAVAAEVVTEIKAQWSK